MKVQSTYFEDVIKFRRCIEEIQMSLEIIAMPSHKDLANEDTEFHNKLAKELLEMIEKL